MINIHFFLSSPECAECAEEGGMSSSAANFISDTGILTNWVKLFITDSLTYHSNPQSVSLAAEDVL